MARQMPLHLTLFPLAVGTTTPVEYIPISNLSQFSHSTKLPGGFWSLEIRVPSNEARYWQWRTERILYRLRLDESGGKVLWEGRLEDVTLSDPWTTTLRFLGYWSNLADDYHNANYNTTGDAIVKDLRDTGLHADTDQLSTSDDQIEAPGVTIDQNYQSDWTIWHIITDKTRGVLAWPDTSDNQMDLGIWEDRIIHYKARNPSTVDWHTFIKPENGGGVERMPSSISWRNLANAILAVYEVSGTVTRTGYTTDTDSLDAYIRREYHTENIRESTATPAEERRDGELALRKDLQQQTDDIIITRVWDTNGVEWPICRVRAGEVIRVLDFTPRTGDLSTLTLDAYRTFFIEETICDHPRGWLRIRPDRPGKSLSDLLVKHNIT